MTYATHWYTMRELENIAETLKQRHDIITTAGELCDDPNARGAYGANLESRFRAWGLSHYESLDLL